MNPVNKEILIAAGIGVGIGLLTGAVVALLFAPASGEETRKAISSKVSEVKEKLSK